MAIKKGPTKGSGGKHRNKLKGYGPTPKAEDRVYHKAYKAKKAAERRQMADPRLAARRRVDKFASADTSDLVYGRNSVLEALRVGVPSSTLYIMSRIEHDDRTREIVKIAGMNGLHMLEADRLEMDRIARSGNHQGVILKVDPFQVLDQNGVGQLIRMATEKGRAVRPDLKCGICGEHGGEPSSVKFCHQVGLDYVSCSPFRVPIARIAAAQAAIEG